MLGDNRFLRTIKLRNILSFGPDTPELELQCLNVLIGPNGSGKSNLIDAIGLLQAAPRNLLEPIQASGGIAEWLWKGPESAFAVDIEVTVGYPKREMDLRHHIVIEMVGQRAQLLAETILNERPIAGQRGPYFFYRYRDGQAMLNVEEGQRRNILREGIALDQSVLSQRRDPDHYPEVTYLGNEYAKIKLFREWNLGRNASPRRPQPADLPADFLTEDTANIALVLNDLEHRSNLRSVVVEKLKNADGSIVDFSTRVLGGTVQLFIHYSGLKSPVPATRLSDGTMRYLCLLSVLCHPEPPPLVCLEEPELGLHPDLLPGLADLLVEASDHMQLIVTTHSDVLVDGLTKAPEAVIVCEKRRGSTEMRRRTGAELTEWLKDYGLGQLWRRGEIGGNRW